MSFQQKEFEMYFSPRPDSNGTTNSITNDKGEVEYDMYEPPPASRPYSMTVEYVLPNPKVNQNKLNAAELEIGDIDLSRYTDEATITVF